MSDSIASLRHKISSAEELKSVVRSMKTIASSSIGQYETAVRSLDEYYNTVQLGLTACFSQVEVPQAPINPTQTISPAVVAIVFGSDQGLVGQFNESMVEFVIESLAKLSPRKIAWTVGDRIQSRLLDTALKAEHSFALPNSIHAITTLMGKVLTELEKQRALGSIDQVFLFYHRPASGSIYQPVCQQLLPLDKSWQSSLARMDWPSNNLPEVIQERDQTLRALLREYIFVSLYRACAESLASENASRLAAMQRAEKNIDEQQADLNRTFHRLRQSGIDEELFDVISGFEALNA
jgi:F-type H+-transporting ATPase subunit gamma